MATRNKTPPLERQVNENRSRNVNARPEEMQANPKHGNRKRADGLERNTKLAKSGAERSRNAPNRE